MMYLDVAFFGSNLFRTLCASWTCMCISFAKLKKFHDFFSNNFSISWSSSSSPSGIFMFLMLAHLEMSQFFLFSPCFFEFLFLHSGLVDYFFLIFPITDLNPGFLLFIIPFGFFFIALSVAFISSLIHFPY